jgi:transposase-like protein
LFISQPIAQLIFARMARHFTKQSVVTPSPFCLLLAITLPARSVSLRPFAKTLEDIPMITMTISRSIFYDETAARAWFEAARWPNGPVCPHCKWTKHYPSKKVGVYRCADITCMKDFTVKTGTVMARSRAKLTQWATAFHLGLSSTRGFSARRIQREIGCHPTTARSMFYRVCEAMQCNSFELPSVAGKPGCVQSVAVAA